MNIIDSNNFKFINQSLLEPLPTMNEIYSQNSKFVIPPPPPPPPLFSKNQNSKLNFNDKLKTKEFAVLNNLTGEEQGKAEKVKPMNVQILNILTQEDSLDQKIENIRPTKNFTNIHIKSNQPDFSTMLKGNKIFEKLQAKRLEEEKTEPSKQIVNNLTPIVEAKPTVKKNEQARPKPASTTKPKANIDLTTALNGNKIFEKMLAKRLEEEAKELPIQILNTPDLVTFQEEKTLIANKLTASSQDLSISNQINPLDQINKTANANKKIKPGVDKDFIGKANSLKSLSFKMQKNKFFEVVIKILNFFKRTFNFLEKSIYSIAYKIKIFVYKLFDIKKATPPPPPPPPLPQKKVPKPPLIKPKKVIIEKDKRLENSLIDKCLELKKNLPLEEPLIEYDSFFPVSDDEWEAPDIYNRYRKDLKLITDNLSKNLPTMANPNNEKAIVPTFSPKDDSLKPLNYNDILRNNPKFKRLFELNHED